jgi:hypothetical protein
MKKRKKNVFEIRKKNATHRARCSTRATLSGHGRGLLHFLFHTMTAEPTPFRISVPDADIKDLKERLLTT